MSAAGGASGLSPAVFIVARSSLRKKEATLALPRKSLIRQGNRPAALRGIGRLPPMRRRRWAVTRRSVSGIASRCQTSV
jgi:hypothetical protein